jgi:hypothetical protein
MPETANDKIPPGPKLDALTAEKVFGWKNVHKHEGEPVGKNQDRAVNWRLGKVPLLFDQKPAVRKNFTQRLTF